MIISQRAKSPQIKTEVGMYAATGIDSTAMPQVITFFAN